jgi:hypothetical protein
MVDTTHPYDGVANELLDWLTTESQWYANALRGGDRAPFSAETSEREKLDFYRAQMFQVAPDGTVQYDTPNAQGRQNLINRLGIDGYSRIYQAVRPSIGRRSEPAEEPEEPYPPENA